MFPSVCLSVSGRCCLDGYFAVRPTLQTLAPIQSSISFSQDLFDLPLFLWPFTFPSSNNFSSVWCLSERTYFLMIHKVQECFRCDSEFIGYGLTSCQKFGVEIIIQLMFNYARFQIALFHRKLILSFCRRPRLFFRGLLLVSYDLQLSHFVS